VIGLTALLGTATGCPAGEDIEDPDEDVQELGTAATVFAVSTSTAEGYSISIRQDRVTGTDPNAVTLVNYFVLGNRNPGGPDESLRYRVTAADDATASAGGLLVGIGLTGGWTPQDLTTALANANLAIQIGTVFGAIPPGPPQLGHLVRLADTALHAVGPGGGCILFDQGVAALGLPDGCADEGLAPQMAGGGPHVLIDAVGPTKKLTISQTELAAGGGIWRFSNRFVLGVREAAITPMTVKSTTTGTEPVTASVGGILLGLGLANDDGPVSTIGLLSGGGIWIQAESVGTVSPGPPQVAISDVANLVDAAITAAGIPGGGCIVFEGGAAALDMAVGCAPGQP
jgi:hypothetical protein